MNRFRNFLACSILVAAPALALAQGHSGQMSHDGMMNEEHMQQMQEHMTQMQTMMKDMRNAESDAERQQIREKHMESMQEHMGMMRQGMQGKHGDMKGKHGDMQGKHGDKKGKHGDMKGKESKDADHHGKKQAGGAGMDAEQRMDMMQSHMTQMQLMMEQLLEHQQQMNQN